MDLEAIIETMRAWPPVIVYLMLFGSALIEYLIPPLPGDTFVVAGAVLVAAFGWHFVPVLVVVTAGATLGAWIDFKVGQWLVRTKRLDKFGVRGREAIDGIVRQMQKHGAIYLAVNRFLPGIRAFFFVAAGIAGLKTHQVLLWSTISAIAWNSGLIALGYALGKNLDSLGAFLTRYSIVVWCLIGAITLFFIGRIFWKKKGKKDDKNEPPGGRETPDKGDGSR